MRWPAQWAAVIVVLVIVGVSPYARVAYAQEPFTLPTQALSTWADRFRIPGTRLETIVVARRLAANGELRPFFGQAVAGLGVSGHVEFTSTRGMVRVVAVNARRQEFLVYEAHQLIAPASAFQVRNACRETCVLETFVPSTLRIELIDASFVIDTIVVNEIVGARARSARTREARAQRETIKAAQEREIIRVLNRRIKAKGLKWIAGQTSISRLSYAEKSRLFACAATDPDTPFNLQGAEYYVGGVLEIGAGNETSAIAPGASSLVPSFDWRARHGANDPSSAYYDGDAGGGGWITSIKAQLCGDCWAHSALGAIEAVMNLYFNRHLDLDLSEQELVSCSGAGGCGGGSPTGALSYIERVGVVDEACFRESGTDQPCSNCCRAPRDRIAIAGYGDIWPSDGEENIKRRLIAAGPLAFGIPSWWHALVLVGYDRDPVTGETIWILKNSWGTGWGERGFGYVKVPVTDMYFVHELRTPVFSMITPYAVACRDADRDGYFNWGLSTTPAASCGSVPPVKDCDDSDPTLALLTEDGYCTALPDTTAPAVTVRTDPSTLWPPNRKMVAVVASGRVTDDGSGVEGGTVRFDVIDEYARVQPSGSIVLRGDGTYRLNLSLEAARTGSDNDGRLYTVIVSARDRAGNSGSSSTVVVVPHAMDAGHSSTTDANARSENGSHSEGR